MSDTVIIQPDLKAREERKKNYVHLCNKYSDIQQEHIFLYIVIGQKTEQEMLNAWSDMPKLNEKGKFV